jgi:sugar lactone lactonase YvrE
MALGLKLDVRDHLLFVAGGFGGQAYVYDARTGEDVAVLQLADPALGTSINDVIVADGAAWFTDSSHPNLYRVPIGADGSIGTPSRLVVSGPAAHVSGPFNMNGIAATPNGRTLIVAHSGDGALYTVNPVTGASAAIAGANVPFVDGILVEAGRLWAVQNFANQVTVFRLSRDLSSASVEGIITSPLFQVPTTVARDGSRLALVNAKFDTGLPPTATSFEVVIVDGP